MKPSSLAVAGMTSVLVAASVLACAASTADRGDEEATVSENLGQAQEECHHAPPHREAGGAPITEAPPPAFTCGGDAGIDPNNGKQMFWAIDCTGHAGQPRGTCVCFEGEPCEGPKVDGGPWIICNGFTVISVYTCPSLFPYERCNAFGQCQCNAYPN